MASLAASTKSLFIRGYRRVCAEVLGLGFTWRGFFTVLALSFLLIQGISFASRLALFSSHQAIVEAIDNDAGEGVRVGQRSYWIGDNNFRYYGPLYFRIANTISQVTIAPGEKIPGPAHLEVERRVHFSLLLLTLVSMYALAWILCGVFTKDLVLRAVGVFFIAPSFMVSGIWTSYLYTVHPDVFLACLCAAGMIATIRMGQDPDNEKNWKWAAFWWGLALCTKLSALFLMPMLLAFLWKGPALTIWHRVRKFALFSLCVYLLLGFPQNFDFFQNLRVLFSFSKYTGGFTLASFLEWWGFWFHQVRWPLLGLAGFYVATRAFPASSPVVGGRLKWFWLPLAVSGLFLLSIRSLELTHEYYVFPFVGAGIAALVMLAQTWVFPALQNKKVPRFALVIFGLALTLPGFLRGNEVNQAGLARVRQCQPGFEKVFDLVRENYEAKRHVYATPYTPVPRDEFVTIDWTMDFARMQEANPELLVFNSGYYARYTAADEVSPFVQKNNDHWQSTQAFFRAFEGKTEVVAPNGQRWVKIANKAFEGCSAEVWTKAVAN